MHNQPVLLVTIRDFRPADLPRLHEIDSICFEQGIAYGPAELASYVRQKGSVVRIAERDKETVGFAIGTVDMDCGGHVITIDILPYARHGGIGTTLLSALHEEFQKAGAAVSTLEVDVDNTTAQAFYHGFGYRRGEILRDYYGPNRNAYRMECRISGPAGS